MAPADYAAMRASDADRLRVQAHLNDAYAEGRLDKQEWEDRATALASAATYGELDRLTADLPRPSPGVQLALQRPGPAPVAQGHTNGTAVAALICGIAQFAFFPLFIPAIILGRSARRQIRVTGEQGDGLARAGLTLGYVGLALAVVGVVVFVFATTGSTAPAGH